MRLLSFYWGIFGVIAFLGFAVFRLVPRVLEMSSFSLTGFQWLALLTFVPYMAYAEGYKGFYLNFSPRIIARANYLRQQQSIFLMILAPVFCMGYIYATRKRIITSCLVTSAIVGAVLLVSMAPQPLRGIIDAGVVVGLMIGIAAILLFWVQAELGNWKHPISADLPKHALDDS